MFQAYNEIVVDFEVSNDRYVKGKFIITNEDIFCYYTYYQHNEHGLHVLGLR